MNFRDELRGKIKELNNKTSYALYVIGNFTYSGQTTASVIERLAKNHSTKNGMSSEVWNNLLKDNSIRVLYADSKSELDILEFMAIDRGKTINSKCRNQNQNRKGESLYFTTSELKARCDEKFKLLLNACN